MGKAKMEPSNKSNGNSKSYWVKTKADVTEIVEAKEETLKQKLLKNKWKSNVGEK